MSYIKSFSVKNGDMFYINDDLDQVIIDCNLIEDSKKEITNELKYKTRNKNLDFINSHPDMDHLRGIDELLNLNFNNIYLVENNIKLKDPSLNAIYKTLQNCSTKINKGETIKFDHHIVYRFMEIKPYIEFVWPDVNNNHFREALEKANNGLEINNICPIIKYTFENGFSAIWFGDLEEDFLDLIANQLLLELNKVNILFASHHGRKSGKLPKRLLDKLNPDVVIIGEGDSSDLLYQQGYNRITQNSAGSITILADGYELAFYCSKEEYKVDFLKNMEKDNIVDGYYIGSLVDSDY